MIARGTGIARRKPARWKFAANGNWPNNYDPALTALGYNVADVSSAGVMPNLPTGGKALVFLGYSGTADSTFQGMVSPFLPYVSSIIAWYLFDEPDPTGVWKTPAIPASNFASQNTYLKSVAPSVPTFLTLMSMTAITTPSYNNTYNTANTGVDYFALDPYPARTDVPNGFDLDVINAAIIAANTWGISTSQIIPYYQAFGGGGYSTWTMPTATQIQQMLNRWMSLVPSPAWEMTYSWGSQLSDQSLQTASADIQAVFRQHNL